MPGLGRLALGEATFHLIVSTTCLETGLHKCRRGRGVCRSLPAAAVRRVHRRRWRNQGGGTRVSSGEHRAACGGQLDDPRDAEQLHAYRFRVEERKAGVAEGQQHRRASGVADLRVALGAVLLRFVAAVGSQGDERRRNDRTQESVAARTIPC